MPLQTLEQFIAAHGLKSGRPSNAYVKVPGFLHLYVRMGPRYIDGTKHPLVFDIANAQASKPGRGTFTRLAEGLHNRGFVLFVECVLNERFVAKLLRMGFTVASSSRLHQDGPPSLYLMPDAPLNVEV